MHFEEIWEEAEKVGTVLNSSIEDKPENIINNIEFYIKRFLNESNKEIKINSIGEVIYYICQLTRIEDINSAQALADSIKSRLVAINNVK